MTDGASLQGLVPGSAKMAANSPPDDTQNDPKSTMKRPHIEALWTPIRPRTCARRGHPDVRPTADPRPPSWRAITRLMGSRLQLSSGAAYSSSRCPRWSKIVQRLRRCASSKGVRDDGRQGAAGTEAAAARTRRVPETLQLEAQVPQGRGHGRKSVRSGSRDSGSRLARRRNRTWRCSPPRRCPSRPRRRREC